MQAPPQYYMPPPPPPPRAGGSRWWIWALVIGVPCLACGCCVAWPLLSVSRVSQSMTQAVPPGINGLQEVWRATSSSGGISCAAMDPSSGLVYAVEYDGSCRRFAPDGTEQQGVLQPPEGTRTLVPANLVRGGDSEFLCAGSPGGVTAITSAGVVLWAYPASSGEAEVDAADLNGDGLDEVIVGSTGGAALDALDSQGHPLWQTSSAPALTTVAAGDINGDGAIEVVASGDRGVAVLDGKTGALLPALSPADAMLALPVHGAPGTATRVVVERYAVSGFHPRLTMVGLNATGTQTWTLDNLGGVPQFAGGSARTRPWVAVAAGFDGAHVIDAERGAIIASIAGIDMTGTGSWLERSRGAEPLLAIAGDDGLHVYRVTGAGSGTPAGSAP